MCCILIRAPRYVYVLSVSHYWQLAVAQRHNHKYLSRNSIQVCAVNGIKFNRKCNATSAFLKHTISPSGHIDFAVFISVSGIDLSELLNENPRL